MSHQKAYFCFAFLMVLLITSASPGLLSRPQGQSPERVIFKTEVHLDLLFHLLAHLDIGEDASSLYSPEYIKMINQEKASLSKPAEPLEGKLDAAREIYVLDQKLRMINFLPFTCRDVESLEHSLRWLAEEEKGESPSSYLPYFKQQFFSSPRARKFLSLLARSLKTEYESFYQDYWERRQKELAPLRESFSRFWLEHGLKLMKPAMKKYNKRVLIYLSLSLTRNGRGFGLPGFFAAAVKFPENQEEIMTSFFFSLHEMTHLFVDEVVLKSIAGEAATASTRSGSQGYELHLLKEKAVVYADYLLCKKFLPAFLTDYTRFFLSLYENKKLTHYAGLSPAELEARFRETITLPLETMRSLQELVASLSDD